MSHKKNVYLGNKSQDENDIINNDIDEDYANFNKKLPWDTNTERFKTTIVFILFAALNSIQNLKNKEVRKKIMDADDNFERFEIFANNFKPSKTDKDDFLAALKKASKFLIKSEQDHDDKFAETISSFFPEINFDLESDFNNFSKKVFSLPKDDLINGMCNGLSKALIQDTLISKEKVQFFNLIEKNGTTYKDLKREQNDVYESYCDQSMELEFKISEFLHHLDISSNIDYYNKCIGLIMNFKKSNRDYLTIFDVENKFDSNLSILSDDYIKQKKFMIVFVFLLNLRAYKSKLSNKIPKHENVELQTQDDTKKSEGSYFILVRKCSDVYVEIKKFMHSLCSMSAVCDVDFDIHVIQFIENFKTFLNSPYFKSWIYACECKDFSDVFRPLVGYLVSKRI